MGYRNSRECLNDLAQTGQLLRIEDEVDPYLEAAEIQRRVYAAGGPAIVFARLRGCRFPMVSNLFGTLERTRFLFRDTLDAVRRLVELKIDPSQIAKHPWHHRGLLKTLRCIRPRTVSRGPILKNQTTIDQLPQLTCWPQDGGAFITLPEVYTEHAECPGMKHSNLGMYRIQVSGGDYEPNKQIGLHYQIHRGIGVHHSAGTVHEGTSGAVPLVPRILWRQDDRLGSSSHRHRPMGVGLRSDRAGRGRRQRQ